MDGLVPGPAHERALMAMVHAERREEADRQARQAAQDERAEQTAVAAGAAYHELREWQDAEIARSAARAQADAQRQAETRRAALEDYAAMLLAAGRQPRSVAEILAAGGGVPPMLLPAGGDPGGPLPDTATRAEPMLAGEPLTRTVPVRLGGESAALLERAEDEARAWDTSSAILRQRTASRRAEAAEPALALPFRHRPRRPAGGRLPSSRCNDPSCCPPDAPIASDW